ncbi:MAG: hypothetical protein QOK43_2653 [Acidimicrobiaceae bacterium]|nr:hypothetical protein [Acidimicrobiaceae bacterium]
MRLRPTFVALTAAGLLAAGTFPAMAGPQTPKPYDPAAPGRETEPVVLTGANFAGWSAPDEVTAKVPNTEGAQCLGGTAAACSHNRYEQPEVATGAALGQGVPVDKLLGYRWDGTKGWVQIPFQVDELATRYLSNANSGFAFYSESDQNLTYVYDQDRFNWTAEDPADPCHAVPRGEPSSPDPVPGLDNNDEVAFMAADAGPQAPLDAALPQGVVDSRQVAITDPSTGQQSFAYVMRAGDGADAPKAAFNASNGYVRYLPDNDSDTFLYSQSSYGSYGATFQGAYFDPSTGQCITATPKQHRPKDTGWVKTPRYAFRYDGRWLMTETRVASTAQEAANAAQSDPAKWQYGPDLIDQWKARAFQQRPGGETPCCGYEEEVNNWGGSSMLMGFRAGPVRAIRASWGADSSTNNIRTEIFYRSQMHEMDNLRVHVIPPGDGIYSQWDYNAGRMTKYYNPYVPQGVDIDGRNDEVFGNGRMHIADDGVRYQSNDKTGVAPVDQQVNQGAAVGTPADKCPSDGTGKACINNDVDTVDPTFSGPAGTLNWEQTSGPWGTFVDRITVKQVTAGAAYSLLTTPYYRDDSCFDDGTGSDPGLHVKPKHTDGDVDSAGQPRECWKPEYGDPVAYAAAHNLPADHFYQGDIGTHGVHILLIADSDNGTLTVPVDEIDSDQRRVILNGDPGNVGELYGRGLEKPAVATVVVEHRAQVAPAPAGSKKAKSTKHSKANPPRR